MNTIETSLNPIKIFIVDDHAVVRGGTREVLNQQTEFGFCIVGETDSAENLAGLLRLKQPDLLLLDINLPGKNGFEILQMLKPVFPNLKIILFSAYTDIQYVRKAMSLQADGYISKTVAPEELQALILQASKETPVYSADIAAKLHHSRSESIAPSLTAREKEILFQIAQGHTNRLIAQDLALSVKTVDTHVANLIKKLDVNNRSQLTAYVYENQLI